MYIPVLGTMISIKKKTLFDIWLVDKDWNNVYNFVSEILNLRDSKHYINLSVKN